MGSSTIKAIARWTALLNLRLSAEEPPGFSIWESPMRKMLSLGTTLRQGDNLPGW
jgi:hypothetical protein